VNFCAKHPSPNFYGCMNKQYWMSSCVTEWIVLGFFKMLGTAHLVTQHNIPYDLNLQHPCCENLKFWTILCEISDFFHVVVEVVILLGCYTALIGSGIPMFWDNLSVQSARDGQAILTWEKRSIGFLKKLTNTTQCCFSMQKSEDLL